jgi:16S rRNA processing protein RimM
MKLPAKTDPRREPARDLSPEGLVAIGRVAKAQGRWGEVAVDPLTDFPERFADLERVFLADGESSAMPSVPLPIESFRMHKGRPVLKLAGISSIGEAQALSGKEIRIPEEELRPLPEGSFYHFQIHGFSVTDRSSGEIGVVEDVLSTGGTDLLVVRGRDGGETLVPLCEEIVRNVDLVLHTVEIEAPEGLVSLNAN